MFKKLFILIIAVCLFLTGACAEENGGPVIAFPDERLEAGTAAEASIRCEPEITGVTVNASMIYDNGTADLLLIGRTVSLTEGEGRISVTPAHKGTLRMEAYYAGPDGERSTAVMIPVDGPDESWPTGAILSEDSAMVLDKVVWAIYPKEGQAPYTIRYHVTLLPGVGVPETIDITSYRSDGETVYCESVFTAAGTARLEAEIVDFSGLKCYLDKEITIKERPFYASVETTKLEEGETLQIHPYTNDDPWHYLSSDEGILTVGEHGRVTALTPGSATVEITSDDSDHTEKIPFVVSPKAEEILCDDITLPEGQSTLLHPTLAPKGASAGGFVFVSTRSDVVSVDETGRITALQPGDSDVVIISKDNPGLTATVRVHSADPGEKHLQGFVDQIALDELNGKGTLTARYGAQLNEGSCGYTVTLLKDGETYAVKRRSGEGNIQFLLTPLEEGHYDMISEAVDESGKTASVTASADITAAPEGGFRLENVMENSPRSFAEGVELVLPEKIYIGMEENASVKVMPGGADVSLRWESSDPSVVAVDKNGRLTALKDGYSIITVTALDHSGVSAKATVTAVTESLKVQTPLNDLHRGQSATLDIVSGTGTGYAYDFSSTNPDVVRVENGIATAVNEGNAAIHVSAEGTPVSLDIPITVLPCLHESGQWLLTRAPECVKAGEETFLCAVCGEKPFTREISPTGHDRGRWSTLTPASQKAEGEKARTCTACGEILERAGIPALQNTVMNGNTACVEGLYLRDYCPKVKDWYMFVPVDLTRNGVTTHRMIASNMLVIGTVSVRVEDGEVTVSYDLIDDDLAFTDEFVTFMTDLNFDKDVDLSVLRNDAFEVPVRIEDDLGGAETAYLLICNRLNYNGCDSPYPRYKDTDLSHQQAVEPLKKLMR